MVGKLMYQNEILMERFEMMEEKIDARLRAVEDKLFATLDVGEQQSFVEVNLIKFEYFRKFL